MTRITGVLKRLFFLNTPLLIVTSQYIRGFFVSLRYLNQTLNLSGAGLYLLIFHFFLRKTSTGLWNWETSCHPPCHREGSVYDSIFRFRAYCDYLPSKWFKGTVVQIEKAITKISHSNYLWFCSILPLKFAIFLTISIVFSVYKQNFMSP